MEEVPGKVEKPKRGRKAARVQETIKATAHIGKREASS
jgi:hypothetical protein